MGIIVLLLLSSLVPFPAAADVFCDNHKVVAATLPKNTSSSPVHMGTATAGKAPDIVYALAFCRDPILNDSDCNDCITNTFEKMLNDTPSPDEQCYKDASYNGDCTIVYSNHILRPSDTTGGNDDGMLFQWNTRNVTVDVQVITLGTGELLVRTMEKAASMLPRRFATGVMDFGMLHLYPRVYSLAECTPDLSPGDCLSCLHLLLDKINSAMSLRMGGCIYITRCYFRYEAYHFYDGQPMLMLGPPSAVPSPALTPFQAPKHRGKDRCIVAPTQLTFLYFLTNQRLTGLSSCS